MGEQIKTPGLEQPSVQEDQNPLELASFSLTATSGPDIAALKELELARETFLEVADPAGSHRYEFMAPQYLGNPRDSTDADRYGIEYLTPELKSLKAAHALMFAPVTTAAVQFSTEFVNSGGPVGPSLYNHTEAAALSLNDSEGTAISQNASTMQFISSAVTKQICEQLMEKGIEISNSPIVFGHLRNVAVGRIVAACIEADLDPARVETVKPVIDSKNINALALAA